MEPVTHVLTGACLARCGLNRRAAYATAGMAVAAEFPDIDTVSSLGGPVTGFQHHRGITHTFLGVPFEAAFLLGVFWLLHRVRVRRVASPSAKPLTLAPVAWPRLYLFLCLALCSHLLLDFTNNYGVRPFFPVDPHWYAASIVFIFDPLIFLLLVGALTLPAVLGLVGREISGTRQPFRGALAARVALLLVAGLWTLRAMEHTRAVALAGKQTLRAPSPQQPAAEPGAGQPGGEPADEAVRPLLRSRASLASPDPFNPFQWYTATDFGPAYQLATVNARNGSVTPGQILNKPQPGPTLHRAEASQIGQVYMDWSPMPWITVEQESARASSNSEVRFHDVRFMGENRWLQRGGEPPLTGFVWLSPQGDVLTQGLDGKAQP